MFETLVTYNFGLVTISQPEYGPGPINVLFSKSKWVKVSDVAAVGWQLPVRFPQVVPPVNYSLTLSSHLLPAEISSRLLPAENRL